MKLDLFKDVTDIVVSIGVGALVGNAIKMTTDPNHGKFKKVAIGVGGFVLSSMVSDAATAYSRERIDKTADLVIRLRNGKKTEEKDIAEDADVAEPTETEETAE